MLFLLSLLLVLICLFWFYNHLPDCSKSPGQHLRWEHFVLAETYVSNEAHNDFLRGKIAAIWSMIKRVEQFVDQSIAFLASCNMPKSVSQARLLQDVIQYTCFRLTDTPTVNPVEYLSHQMRNTTLLVARSSHRIYNLLYLGKIFLEISRSASLRLFTTSRWSCCFERSMLTQSSQLLKRVPILATTLWSGHRWTTLSSCGELERILLVFWWHPRVLIVAFIAVLIGHYPSWIWGSTRPYNLLETISAKLIILLLILIAWHTIVFPLFGCNG